MAKDGTFRGGRRVRAGGKPEALADKVAFGKEAVRMELPVFEDDVIDEEGVDLSEEAAEMEGADMPPPDEYLSENQRDGKPFGAADIYTETWKWLKARGCEKLVNNRLLETYSVCLARYIQCERMTNQIGLLGKHPTTGAAMESPYVAMSLKFQKQANLVWYEIFDIVKQNCTERFSGSPNEDIMDKLLRKRGV